MIEITRTTPDRIHEYEYHVPPGLYNEENSRVIEITEKLPNGEVSSLGIMYIVRLWEGVASAHAYLGPHVQNHKSPFKLTRGARKELDKAAKELGVWRVQAESPYSAPRYSRWLTLLGFELEACLKKYYPNGEDMWLLTKFYDE